MAEVTVRWFAVLREARGVDVERVELTDGETIASLYGRLIPAGPHGRVPVGFARNHAHCEPSTVLANNDEVAFLPPLGGG